MNDILNFLIATYKKSLDIFYLKSDIIKHKSANDVLSEADLKLNAFFCENIKEAYHYCEIIAEESANDDLTEKLTFVVDPLDGTCNYSRGLELCGIQIAVFKNKECILSLIGLPYFDELYYAIKGGGAYFNGKKLTADAGVDHGNGILALSDFYSINDDISFDNQFELVKRLQPKFLKTRLFGAACIDFCGFAASKVQAYLCYYRHIWDIAPGLLLAEEAGGVFRKINGSPYEYEGHSIVLANNTETLDIILSTAKPLIR